MERLAFLIEDTSYVNPTFCSNMLHTTYIKLFKDLLTNGRIKREDSNRKVIKYCEGGVTFKMKFLSESSEFQ